MFKLVKTDRGRCGHSLQRFPDRRLSLQQLEAKFGEPDYSWAGEEEEKGYGWMYIFEDEQGNQVSLYNRWIWVRIGGFDEETANRFNTWLNSQFPEEE